MAFAWDAVADPGGIIRPHPVWLYTLAPSNKEINAKY